MALSSPGVQVTIIDQSQYLPSASSSVPFLLVATAQNKINAAGTGVAPATTAANANKLYQVTSQRDLVNLFGNPFFYKTTNGTSIHGYELNEYGLMAAYSLLGSTNRCYILRADIDLGQLVGSLSRPSGAPVDGTYWLDTTNSVWGIYEFNASTGKFVNIVPHVISDADNIVDGYPLDTIGNIGDYAVIPLAVGDDPSNESSYFLKNRLNTWVRLGNTEWSASLFTVLSSTPATPMTSGKSFTITTEGGGQLTVTVASGTVAQQIDDLVTQINSFDVKAVTAYNYNNKLAISVSYPQTRLLRNANISLSGVGGDATALTQLGLTEGNYYQPEVVFGPSSQMPLWTSSQEFPHPTGSVWIKTSTAGAGMDIALASYNSTRAAWTSLNVAKYNTIFAATADLDSSGGKNIPAGTVVASVLDSYSTPDSPVILWERLATGPTVVTSSKTGNDISYSAGNTVHVSVSTPGSAGSPASYSFVTTGTDAASFVFDWQTANIPNTSISITTDFGIQIEHTKGGELIIHDYNTSGQSTGVLDGVGLTVATNSLANLSNSFVYGFTTNSATQSAVSRGGSTLTPGSPGYPTGFSVSVTNANGLYYRNYVAAAGTNYQVGDKITISGAALAGEDVTNDLTLVVTSINALTGGVTAVEVYSGQGRVNYITTISNWVKFTYTANEGAPATLPTNGNMWFYSTNTQVDIMVNKNGQWIGYKNTNYDSDGHPSSTGSNATDPNGPIMAADAPTKQTDGTALVYGDLWIDTNDLENYPVIYRWQLLDGVDQWVKISVSDQTSSNGILFADARWGSNGSINPVDDPIPTIVSLLTSDYVDLDCPDPDMFPQGMLLWNTRRSGYNVKKFVTNYFTSAKYPDAGLYDAGDSTNTANLPKVSYTWVSASGLKSDGSAYMGRKAQRTMVVQALKAAINTNTTIREEDTFFNLISSPNYPELQPDMIQLNNDRNNTAYIVGDTPLRLPDQATDLINWATNANGATSSGEDGWVTRDEYMGVFYPSGITTDLTGAQVVVPASHMMLRTMLRNDTIAYPWLAPAGTRRGTIDNASNIGYIDATTGEFITVKNRMSIRDVLYTNQINPLTYFTGIGLLNYGNKNSKDTQSALDRTNVARLVAYIRYNCQIAARPFVFEPNDSLTRQQLTGVIESLFVDLVAKRGLYDYLVVCDETNNYASRIDRNELWVDIAIKPVKAAEFIYIPVRILNTGDKMAIV